MHYDPEEKIAGHLGIRFVKKEKAGAAGGGGQTNGMKMNEIELILMLNFYI